MFIITNATCFIVLCHCSYGITCPTFSIQPSHIYTTCFFVLWHWSYGTACPAFILQCTFITNATCSFVLCHCICDITCPTFSIWSSQIPLFLCFVSLYCAIMALPVPPSLCHLSHLHCTVIQMPPVPLFYVIAVVTSPVPPLAYNI